MNAAFPDFDREDAAAKATDAPVKRMACLMISEPCDPVVGNPWRMP